MQGAGDSALVRLSAWQTRSSDQQLFMLHIGHRTHWMALQAILPRRL